MPLSTNLPVDKVDGGAGHTAAHNATNLRVNEVATAVNLLPTTADVASAVATHTADTTAVHGIADTTALATATSVAAAVTAHAGAADPHGDRAAAAAALASHEADTTAVHGIADTSVLATATSVTAAVTAHSGASDPHGDRAAAAAALATHTADTTAVHGITDTALLATTTVTDALDARIDTLEGASPGDTAGYLLACFGLGPLSSEVLDLYYSPDGRSFVDAGINPVFTGTGGSVVRDPSIIIRDDYFYVAHTRTSFTGTSWDVIRSADLLNWTKMATVDMSSIGSVTNTWAPELIVDTNGDVYAFTAINQTTIYRQKATASDLSTWSSPSLVTFSGGPAAIIDPTFILRAGTWYCFYKNEVSGQKRIERATAATLSASSWTVDRTGDWAGWGDSVEGPSMVTLTDGRYRIYMDRYTGPGLHYSESTDLGTWSTLTAIAVTPPILGDALPRHGSVIPLSAPQAATVFAAFAGGKPRRKFYQRNSGTTLSLVDEDKYLAYNSDTTAGTFTLPASAPEGFSLSVTQAWTQPVTINNNGDAGIKASAGDATSVATSYMGQVVTFVKDADNHWYAIGLGSDGSGTPSITSPSDVTSLYAWYKADAITGLSDGAAVASWVESQGTGSDAIQANGALQPLYKTAIVNGEPVVRFDGTDDWLDASPASASLANFTIFAVVRPSDNTGSRSITSCSGSGGLQLRVNNGFVIISKDGVTDAASGSTTLSTTNFTIVEITVSASASSIRLNGTLDATGSGYTPTGGRTNRISRNGGEYWAGDIAEIVTYSSVLSVDDRVAVRGLLGTKYGITVT